MFEMVEFYKLRRQKMKRKTFLSLLLAAVMFLSLAPITALAAGTTNVWVDNTLLTDGENSVGDGTATLN